MTEDEAKAKRLGLVTCGSLALIKMYLYSLSSTRCLLCQVVFFVASFAMLLIVTVLN